MYQFFQIISMFVSLSFFLKEDITAHSGHFGDIISNIIFQRKML